VKFGRGSWDITAPFPNLIPEKKENTKKECITVNPSAYAAPVSRNKSDAFQKVPIAGIVRFSSVDYPGKLAAVFFTQGCPWACSYCHNAHLRPLRGDTVVSPAALRAFLKERRGFLDAVVISGGEPTLHPDLPDFALEIKKAGYDLGLHTNGMNSLGLERILPLCGWVGMDVKATRELYPEITGSDAFDQVMVSAKKLIASGTPHEFRMTFHPALLSEKNILEVATHLSKLGAKRFVLQQFRAQGCANQELCRSMATSSLSISQKLNTRLAGLFAEFAVRGA
jgi:pyruvate formate lyase activating enzyme